MELKQINLKDRIINLFGEIDESNCKETIDKIILEKRKGYGDSPY